MTDKIDDNNDFIQNENDELLLADEDDELLLADEETLPDSSTQTNVNPKTNTWKVMIVDDDGEIHNVMRFGLKTFLFQEKKLNLISAYSGAEAKSLIETHSDTSLIFLDVVMEKRDSGLMVVKYIRDNLKNYLVRIVLHTGQQGHSIKLMAVLLCPPLINIKCGLSPISFYHQ